MDDNDFPTPGPLPPRVIAVDSLWFDPALVNKTNHVNTTQVVVTGGKAILVPANINRWGLMVFNPAGPATITIGPWPDLTTYQFAVIAQAAQSPMYTLANYGPLISNVWYVISTGSQSIRVIELIRN
jgi:hypothetical protein